LNDCIIAFCLMCNEKECRCKNYISINSEKGKIISAKYDDRLDGVLEPIRQELREKYLTQKY